MSKIRAGSVAQDCRSSLAVFRNDGCFIDMIRTEAAVPRIVSERERAMETLHEGTHLRLCVRHRSSVGKSANISACLLTRSLKRWQSNCLGSSGRGLSEEDTGGGFIEETVLAATSPSRVDCDEAML